MSADWKPIWEKMQAWQAQGLKVALATVVETWGSSPRAVGSYLILNEQGHMEGSVSGGCVEGAVIVALEAVMAGGAPKILEFTVTQDAAWEAGLSCGGHIKVFVEPCEQKLCFIEEIFASKTDLCLTTDIATGATTLHTGGGLAGKSQLVQKDNTTLFENILVQPLKLLVVGAVHITQAMEQMAKTLGVDIAIIDPRPAFAHEDRFLNVKVDTSWPDDALKAHEITSGTAVVTLTHDPKLDDAALAVALRTPAFYIASLGSRKTHAARLERLSALGFTEAELARIHGPAGLNVGAKTPAEIALSVLAEMVASYRLGGGK